MQRLAHSATIFHLEQKEGRGWLIPDRVNPLNLRGSAEDRRYGSEARQFGKPFSECLAREGSATWSVAEQTPALNNVVDGLPMILRLHLILEDLLAPRPLLIGRTAFQQAGITTESLITHPVTEHVKRIPIQK